MFIYATLFLLVTSATLGHPNFFERQVQCSDCTNAFLPFMCIANTTNIFCGCTEFLVTGDKCYKCLTNINPPVDPFLVQSVKAILDICRHCQTDACGSILGAGECVANKEPLGCMCSPFKQNGTECAGCLVKVDPSYTAWFGAVVEEVCSGSV
jgi:hypothetical protein